MKQIRKKDYSQFSWLKPEERLEGKIKDEIIKESYEVKVDRRKVLNSLMFL